jgi:hypothetical protein
MAANQRERRSARDAYSEPEQWLLQLLAAQRRRWVCGCKHHIVKRTKGGCFTGGASSTAVKAAPH